MCTMYAQGVVLHRQLHNIDLLNCSKRDRRTPETGHTNLKKKKHLLEHPLTPGIALQSN